MTRLMPVVFHRVRPVAPSSTHTEPCPSPEIGPLHHLERTVARDVGQRRRREGAAVEPGRPLQLTAGVVRLDGVGVRGAGEVRARPDDDPGGAAGEEAADRGGRVDDLVGVGPADLVPLAGEDPEVAAVGVLSGPGAVARPTGRRRTMISFCPVP